MPKLVYLNNQIICQPTQHYWNGLFSKLIEILLTHIVWPKK